MKDYIITKPNTLLNGVDKILNYLSKIKTDNIDERINFLINTKLNNPESLEYVEKTENSFEIFSSEINMNEKISFIFGEDNVYVNVMFLNSFPVRGRKLFNFLNFSIFFSFLFLNSFPDMKG